MKFFLIILLTVGLWSFDEIINTMRENDVQISFSNKKNSLKPIPKGMLGQEFIKATQLDFNGMNLSDNLPDFLGQMKNLKVLNLDGVDISVGELKKIEGLEINVLNLNNNPNLFKKRGKLIPIISKFGLTKLYLANTGGRESNYLSIGTSLPELTVLDLSNNRINSLENLYLGNLSGLKTLNLSNNPLGSFSTADLPKRTLQKLNLANTNFSKFNYTGDFPSLVSLDLSGNSSVKIDKKYKSEMVLSKATITPINLISQSSFNSTSKIPHHDNAKGITVIDRLMYQNQPFSDEDNRDFSNWDDRGDRVLTLNEARLYCRNLTLGNYDDWRLPLYSELRKLLIKDKKNNFFIKEFENNMPEYSWFWTIDGGSSPYFMRKSPRDWMDEGMRAYTLCVR